MGLAQFRWRQHLHLARMAQQVHQQLGVVHIGQPQLPAAVGPAIRCAGAGAIPRATPRPPPRREQQLGLARRAAGKDAVARSSSASSASSGTALAGVQQRGRLDAVQREAAQALAGMAPGVQIPGMAVVHQALRRHLALAQLAALLLR
jgi:hypothetical protein